ncbi:MAG: hypothetical protein ACPMAG_13890 [Limisphaerales bacterium]
MNEPTHNLITLSQKQLAFIALILFAFQILATVLFSEKSFSPLPNYQPQFLGRMDFDQIKADSECYQLFNPALFAFPAPKGFSGKIWLKVNFPTIQYYEWNGESLWLGLFPDYLGNDFGKLLVSSKPQTEVGIFELQPSFTTVEGASPPLPKPVSKIRVEGELARRPLLYVPELPIFYSNDVYPPSVVYAVVNADGFVISSALVNESGFPPADSAAIELTKKIIFTPLKSQQNNQLNKNMAFGKIIFEWHFSKTNKVEKPQN